MRQRYLLQLLLLLLPPLLNLAAIAPAAARGLYCVSHWRMELSNMPAGLLGAPLPLRE